MDTASPPCFRWHPKSKVLGLSQLNGESAAKSALNPTVLNDVHFISDFNAEHSLSVLAQSVMSRKEFCVHPPQYEPDNSDAVGKGVGYFQVLSSGSNGRPKRIRRTATSWITSFDVNASLNLYAALEAAHHGCNIHALSQLRPDHQWQAMQNHLSSIVYSTPTQLRQLCDQGAKLTQTNTSIRHIFSGGGKLDSQTAQLLSVHFPNATLSEFYGASETSFISISDKHTPIESVGKLYPGVQVRIDNNNTTTEGDIWVKSPYLFDSYINASASDAQHKDGYICVGDVGRLCNDGYLYLSGRQTRRVNIAGKLVFPEMVEAAMLKHKNVSACAVVATADEHRGSVLVAMIELSADNVGHLEHERIRRELLVSVRTELDALQAPRAILFVDCLPRLPSGKPDYLSIQQQFA